MYPGFKVKIISINIQTGQLVESIETLLFQITHYPRNSNEYISDIVNYFTPAFILDQRLPVDISAVYDLDDNIVWTERRPDFQIDKVALPL